MHRVPLLTVSLLLAGCTPVDTPEEDTLECTATVNDAVVTVIGVEWSAAAGADSYVEFGETDTYGLRTPTAAGEAVHLDLVGVPAETDVYWRGVSTTADGTATCHGVTRTGTLPTDLPTVTVAVDGDGQDAARYVIGAFFSGAGGRGGRTQLAAFRRDGEVVWYYEGEEDTTALDVHYAVDGVGLLFNQFDGQMGGPSGAIHRVSLSGELLATTPAPLAHHMFCELPDGTLAYQAVDSRSYTDPHTGESAEWVGDAIVEVSPDGVAETVFSVWDVLDPVENDRMDHSIYPGKDWTHGNMITYAADTGRYLLSLGHADDLLTIDRATGDLVTVWGVDGIAASPAFDYQHDAHLLGNGNVLMFMSQASGAGAVEYAQVDGALEEVWRSDFDQSPFALGQARRLPNGNTFVNGGAANPLYEVTPDGEIVWEIGAEAGAVFGQFQLVSDLYTGAP